MPRRVRLATQFTRSNFRDRPPDRNATRNRADRTQSREVLYPDHLGLDPYVMKTAFAWLDVRAAQTPDERLAWLGLIREILGIVLQVRPDVDHSVDARDRRSSKRL